MLSGEWMPRTQLGRAVKSGAYDSLHAVLATGERIKEPGIVDHFNKSFEQYIFVHRRVNKAVTSGKLSRFSVLLAIGDRAGIIGIGKAKSRDKRLAVDKALARAKKTLAVVRVGHRDNPYTVPQRRMVKVASSRVIVEPVSLRTGVVGGKFVKLFCQLAGIRDVRIRLEGSKNRLNYIQALYHALSQ